MVLIWFQVLRRFQKDATSEWVTTSAILIAELGTYLIWNYSSSTFSSPKPKALDELI